MNDKNSKLVYSTDSSMSQKKKPLANEKGSPLNPGQQKVIIKLERKGRGGKTVTVIEGLAMKHDSKNAFLKQLKGKLGTGGAVKEDCFEFQGDHCNRLRAELNKMGYKPKRSGG